MPPLSLRCRHAAAADHFSLPLPLSLDALDFDFTITLFATTLYFELPSRLMLAALLIYATARYQRTCRRAYTCRVLMIPRYASFLLLCAACLIAVCATYCLRCFHYSRLTLFHFSLRYHAAKILRAFVYFMRLTRRYHAPSMMLFEIWLPCLF